MDRTAELGCMTEAVAGLTTGRQAAVEVVGAAGTGKTTLLAAAVQRIAGCGVEVRTGSAAERERRIPFQVFLHAFGQQPGGDGDDERFWESAAGAPLGIEQFLVYRGGRRRIAARAAGRGLVLILDDLQWADTMSLDLIGHLLRYPVAAPLLLVLAYRPEPAVRWFPGPAGRARLCGPRIQRIDLGAVPVPVPEKPSGSALAPLTDRQREIARLAGTGATTRLIARQLSLSPRTVDAHLSRIYRLLDVRSRAGLAALVAHR